jgi:hypothetical protein
MPCINLTRYWNGARCVNGANICIDLQIEQGIITERSVQLVFT